MNAIKLTTILFFVCVGELVYGQTEVCECSVDPSILDKIDYLNVLPASILKKNRVTDVNIQTQDSLNLKITLRFDSNGRLVSRTEYLYYGAAKVYTFKRNAKGQVMQQIKITLDNLGKKKLNTSDEITDYTYDRSGNLIKIKKRNRDGYIAADKVSDFTTYTYDSQGRILEEFRFTYFENNQSASFRSKHLYDDKKFQSQDLFYDGKKISLKGTSTYSPDWKLLSTSGYDKKSNKLLFEERFVYDSDGKLVTYKTQGGFSECADNGKFTDTYEYSDTGLLESITHTYGTIVCRANLEYINQ